MTEQPERPLSDEMPEMVEVNEGWPQGPLFTVLVILIAVGVLFCLCAPIFKAAFL